jgi:hypothetical protein
MKRKQADEVRQALLEFFHGMRRLEALRREAAGDEAKLERFAGIVDFGLRKTERVLAEAGLLSERTVLSPAAGAFLH